MKYTRAWSNEHKSVVVLNMCMSLQKQIQSDSYNTTFGMRGKRVKERDREGEGDK